MRRGRVITDWPAGVAVALSVTLVLLAGLLGLWAGHLWQDGGRMTSASYCPDDDLSQRDCLVLVAGTLEGPYDGSRRHVGDEWTFRPHRSVSVVKTVSVAGHVATRLEEQPAEDVVAVFWEESLVAFRDRDTGQLLTTRSWGTSFAAAAAWGALLLVLSSVRGFWAARLTLAATGAWWRSPVPGTSGTRAPAWWGSAAGGAVAGLWVALVAQDGRLALVCAAVVSLGVWAGTAWWRSPGGRAGGRNATARA